MIGDAEFLLTLAEVAVAFAGFASLVGILGRRSSQDDPRILAVRMRGMILSSLLVVAFSMLPLLLQRYGFDESGVWRAASAAFASAAVPFQVWLWRRSLWLRSLGLPRSPIIPVVVVIVHGTAGLTTLLLLLNVFVINSEWAPAVYLTCLGLYLFLAGLAFTLIVFSFLAGRREVREEVGRPDVT